LETLISNDINDVICTISSKSNIKLAIIDSIQTIYDTESSTISGSINQIKYSTQKLVNMAKSLNIIVVIVGHITKDGQIAGPKLLEHMVDTVLYFDNDSQHNLRILRSIKNRFGSTNEIGVFLMTEKGLEDVINPSKIFLENTNKNTMGSAIVSSMYGTRTMLVEIQALVIDSPMNIPRRATIGCDASRLSMLLAVINKHYGIFFGNKEVYLSVIGGIDIVEPALDLAAAFALISAATNCYTDRYVVFGEICLSGEIRKVSYDELRIKEANRLGFEKIICPKNSSNGKHIHSIQHIRELKKVFIKDR
jgi:DNA repair protein RadA/Sms